MDYKAKIVMVGGGSYNWSPKLLSDIIQTDDLEGSEIVLLDIDLKAAELVKQVGETMARSQKRKYKFTATSDEDEAFRGADFVIITISTGGLETMRHDLDIPEKYGIYQAVGDTVGPGGWSRMLRNVPVFTAMAQKIEKLSPNAVVLNYSNPMAGLTGAISEATSLRNTGLCHGVFGTYWLLEKLFDVEQKDISANFCGVNHFFWLLDFSIKGEPGYPLLWEKIKDCTVDEAVDNSNNSKDKRQQDHYVFEELLRKYRYLGYLADNHSSEFVGDYLLSLDKIEKYKIKRKTIDFRMAKIEKSKQRAMDLVSGKEKMPERSCEIAVDVMKSFINNTPYQDVVNLPNVGQIENLPCGAVVETMGTIDASGFKGIETGKMPEELRKLVEPHCNTQIMTLEAAMNGDKELAFEALRMDPLCVNLTNDEINKMGDELLVATSDYLPQFK